MPIYIPEYISVSIGNSGQGGSMLGEWDGEGGSLELQDHDFRIGTEAQWRSPGSGAARGEYLHFADAAESIDKLAINPARHPTPWDKLSHMRVAGKLQRHTGGFGDLRMIRGVRQQDARALAVDANALKDGSEVLGMGGVQVRHANDL